MKTNQVSISAFDSIVAQFLATQDSDEQSESWRTERGTAALVLSDLRRHLFQEELDKEDRRARYLELKKEFDPQ